MGTFLTPTVNHFITESTSNNHFSLRKITTILAKKMKYLITTISALNQLLFITTLPAVNPDE